MVTAAHNFCLSRIIAALRMSKLESEGQAELRARCNAPRPNASSNVLGTPMVKATHAVP